MERAAREIAGPVGADTRTGAEDAPERQPPRQTLVQWTAALTFALTTAVTYRWLCERV